MSTLLKAAPLLLLMLTAGCSGQKEKATQDNTKKEHIMRSRIDALGQAKEAKNLMNEATEKEAQEAKKLTR